MALYVAPYTFDWGYTKPLLDMTASLIGDGLTEEVLDLAPQEIIDSYQFVDNNVRCRPAGFRPRYVQITRDVITYRYTIPFAPTSASWFRMIDQLNDSSTPQTWRIVGESISQYTLNLIANV